MEHRVTHGRSLIEVALLLGLFLWNFAASLAVVRIDTNRLPDDRRARAWPEATQLSATFAFGPFALVVHFAKTRHPLFGVVLGAAWAAAIVLVSTVATEVASSLGLLHG
jgi:hypothetical protein